nr:PREDICTED: uncharacterized protein LOC109037126 isoform X1 [Bemisia tabaci]XP_018907186.1 PREDICTED: uncharacterized protein LOC109037126 isoform X1 [Bemisia tabaci]
MKFNNLLEAFTILNLQAFSAAFPSGCKSKISNELVQSQYHRNALEPNSPQDDHLNLASGLRRNQNAIQEHLLQTDGEHSPYLSDRYILENLLADSKEILTKPKERVNEKDDNENNLKKSRLDSHLSMYSMEDLVQDTSLIVKVMVWPITELISLISDTLSVADDDDDDDDN